MSTTLPHVREAELPLDVIDPPQSQHRHALDPVELGRLVDSINELGLLEAIGVRANAYGDRYEVIWGWRRFNACRLAGKPTIRARVFPHDYDADRARAAENEFREDLSPIERAEVCQRWLHEGAALPEIARRWRREQRTIEDWLALLALPGDLRVAVHERQISASVARELAKVDFGDYRRGLIDEAIRAGATTRVVAAWAAAYAADRERIITNTVTVSEIIQEAHKYVVKVLCEANGEEVPLEASRTIRVCSACYADLQAAFRAAHAT